MSRIFKETVDVWKNNVEQAVSSKSADMWDVVNKSQYFVALTDGKEVSFVGHSKGGAEAAAAAVATNKNAIVFNPANTNLKDYGLNGETYTGHITQYVVRNEILSETTIEIKVGIMTVKQIKLGPILRSQIPTIETIWLSGINWPLGGIAGVGIEVINHMMVAVQSGLQRR